MRNKDISIFTAKPILLTTMACILISAHLTKGNSSKNYMQLKEKKMDTSTSYISCLKLSSSSKPKSIKNPNNIKL